MTIAEVALMHQRYWIDEQANLRIIKMTGWERTMYFEDTKLPWALPSPNIARPESTLTFPATVIFEGTKLSEGRGTTQSLEIIGHPEIKPFLLFEKHLLEAFRQSGLSGFAIRPITFLPTFQKHADRTCGGFQIHITDRKAFKPWRVGQFLQREMYRLMGAHFEWKEPPYEYNYELLPIDIINGTDKLRKWVEGNGSLKELDSFENLDGYLAQLAEIKIY